TTSPTPPPHPEPAQQTTPARKTLTGVAEPLGEFQHHRTAGPAPTGYHRSARTTTVAAPKLGRAGRRFTPYRPPTRPLFRLRSACTTHGPILEPMFEDRRDRRGWRPIDPPRPVEVRLLWAFPRRAGGGAGDVRSRNARWLAAHQHRHLVGQSRVAPPVPQRRRRHARRAVRSRRRVAPGRSLYAGFVTVSSRPESRCPASRCPVWRFAAPIGLALLAMTRSARPWSRTIEVSGS